MKFKNSLALHLSLFIIILTVAGSLLFFRAGSRLERSLLYSDQLNTQSLLNNTGDELEQSLLQLASTSLDRELNMKEAREKMEGFRYLFREWEEGYSELIPDENSLLKKTFDSGRIILESGPEVMDTLIRNYRMVDGSLDSLAILLRSASLLQDGEVARRFRDQLPLLEKYRNNPDPLLLQQLRQEWLEAFRALESRGESFGIVTGKLPGRQELSDMMKEGLEFLDRAGAGAKENRELYEEEIAGILLPSLEEFAEGSDRILALSRLAEGDWAGRSARGFHWLIVLVFGLLMVLFSLVFFRWIDGLEKIGLGLENLISGREDPDPDQPRGNEARQVFDLALTLGSDLRQKAAFAKALREGERTASDPDPGKDPLGIELGELAAYIRSMEEEQSVLKEEQQKRIWHNEGLAHFGAILRSERDKVDELAYRILKELTDYMKAIQGSIYILREENGNEAFLERVATYAWERRKFGTDRILPGEGLAGTCLIEKETIYLTDIPEDYLTIRSGLGESRPSAIIILPLKAGQQVLGILELASFSTLKDYEIRFLEELTESMAVSLESVLINEKTGLTLEESRKEVEELTRDFKDMQRKVSLLEENEKSIRERMNELNSINNAFQDTLIVSEFSPNGRYIRINENYSLLFELKEDQLAGKHHSEMASADRYSDAYKEFWKDLRNGRRVEKESKYELFSGKVLWLSESYHPVQDADGKISKIICIALDITGKITSREAFEKQARELKQKSREMESLMEAVNTGIIKCEFDPEGSLITVNENYCNATGYTARELTGKNLQLFLKGMEKDQFNTLLPELIKGKHWKGLMRRTKPTGEELWLMTSLAPIEDESGEVFKIILLAQDVTENKLKYQMLEDANREIDRLTKHINKKED